MIFLEQGVRKILCGVGSDGLIWVKVPVQPLSASEEWQASALLTKFLGHL